MSHDDSIGRSFRHPIDPFYPEFFDDIDVAPATAAAGDPNSTGVHGGGVSPDRCRRGDVLDFPAGGRDVVATVRDRGVGRLDHPAAVAQQPRRRVSERPSGGTAAAAAAVERPDGELVAAAGLALRPAETKEERR